MSIHGKGDWHVRTSGSGLRWQCWRWTGSQCIAVPPALFEVAKLSKDAQTPAVNCCYVHSSWCNLHSEQARTGFRNQQRHLSCIALNGYIHRYKKIVSFCDKGCVCLDNICIVCVWTSVVYVCIRARRFRIVWHEQPAHSSLFEFPCCMVLCIDPKLRIFGLIGLHESQCASWTVVEQCVLVVSERWVRTYYTLNRTDSFADWYTMKQIFEGLSGWFKIFEALLLPESVVFLSCISARFWAKASSRLLHYKASTQAKLACVSGISTRFLYNIQQLKSWSTY